MRGTFAISCNERFWAGIIPAYAGNIGADCVTLGIDRDHPRVCGEHFCAPIVPQTPKGSSPRMRGT